MSTQQQDPDNDTDAPFRAIADADVLDTFVGALDTLVDEAKLRVGPDALQATAVDPANVAMVDVSVLSDAFESWQVAADDLVLGVNLGRLSDILGMTDADDLVRLDYDAETRKLEISTGGLDYTLALIDPDSIRKEPDLPDLDLPAEVLVEGRELARGIKAADMVSDHITLGVDAAEPAFEITAEGDTDDVRLDLADDRLVDLTATEDAASIYSLDYCKDLNRAIPADAEVTIELGNEFPVVMQFGIVDGDGRVRYMIAPRIRSD